MKPKHLTVLTALALVAGIIAFAVRGKGKPEQTDDLVESGAKLFEDVGADNVTTIEIAEGGEKVTLVQGEDGWGVGEREGYPADLEKIRRVVTKIAGLEVQQTIEAGESKLGRFDLKMPEAEEGEKVEGTGKSVALKSESGDKILEMVIGKRPAGAVTSGESMGTKATHFLRDAARDGQVFVITESMYDLGAKPTDWLKRDFFRINKPDDVTVTQAEGTVFRFSREKDGDPAVMEGLSENEELNTTNTNAITAPFSSASFKDVATGDGAKPENTGLDNPVAVDVTTFDGLTYNIKIGKGKGDNTDSNARNATISADNHYLTVDVSGTLPEKREPQEDETVADDASDEDKEKAKELKEKRDAEFLAEQNNLKKKLETEKSFAGTVFKVDSWVVDKFFKGRDELVKEKEAEKTETVGEGLGALAPEADKPPIVATTPPISVADILEQGKAKTEEATEDAAETVEAAKESAESVKEKAEEAAEELKAELEKAAEDAGEEVEEVAEDAGEAVEEAAEGVEEAVEDTADSAGEQEP